MTRQSSYALRLAFRRCNHHTQHREKRKSNDTRWTTMMSNTPNIQQQEARELAARCATVLQHRFGARRVIPFGSVVEHGTWHPGSDLDLAVEGIAPEQFFRAWSVLRELLPPGLGRRPRRLGARWRGLTCTYLGGEDEVRGSSTRPQGTHRGRIGGSW